jgi:hypothetical protein
VQPKIKSQVKPVGIAHTICIAAPWDEIANPDNSVRNGNSSDGPTNTHHDHDHIRGRLVSRAVPWLGFAIFARFDGADAVLWHRIRRSNGIIAIMGGANPSVVPDGDTRRALDWIEELIARRTGAGRTVQRRRPGFVRLPRLPIG